MSERRRKGVSVSVRQREVVIENETYKLSVRETMRRSERERNVQTE